MGKAHTYRKSSCSAVKRVENGKKGNSLGTKISFCVRFPIWVSPSSPSSVILLVCFNVLFLVYLVMCFYITGVLDPL